MTISFDFEAPPVYFSLDAIDPNNDTGTKVALGTIPLASADFPLQSGRVVVAKAEFIGVDSNGEGLAAECSASLTPGHAFQAGGFNAAQGGSAIGIPYLTLNGDNDLVVSWGNQNTTVSGVTHDVAVRVTLRWSGS